MHVAVLGGGVIGLMTAWSARRRGFTVTVVDRQPSQRDGCSFGNAGMLVPSHFIPLAAPGMVALGLKWMWNPESPFYIRPRASWDLVRWAARFWQAATKAHVARSAPLLRDLHLQSRLLYQQLAAEFGNEFGLVEAGLVMLCKSEKTLDEETHVAEQARELGIPAERLDPAELAQLDPAITMSVAGGIYFPRDCHLSPNRLMEGIERRLAAEGVQFRWSTEVTGLRTEGGRIRAAVLAGERPGELEADQFVLCGGVWSEALGKGLELSIPMQAGKGYSVTLEQPRQLPRLCSILTEARVAVTPMGSTLRLGGTMPPTALLLPIVLSREGHHSGDPELLSRVSGIRFFGAGSLAWAEALFAGRVAVSGANRAVEQSRRGDRACDDGDQPGGSDGRHRGAAAV